MHLIAIQAMCTLTFIIFANILFLAVLGQNVGVSSFFKEYPRIRRQGPVVQPDWVPNSDFNLFQDFNVRVTDRKLDETEAIRELIQGTVDSGTYEVELDEGDFEEGELEAGEEIPPLDLPESAPELKVDPNTMTIPELEPKSEPEPESEPEAEPEPPSAPIPENPKPKSIPRIPDGENHVPRRSKIFSRSFFNRAEGGGGSRFIIWLRKTLNRS